MVLFHGHSLLTALPMSMPHHAKVAGPIMGGPPNALPTNLLQVNRETTAEIHMSYRNHLSHPGPSAIYWHNDTYHTLFAMSRS